MGKKTSRAKSEKPDTTILIDNGMGCTACGDEYKFRFPADGSGMPMWEFDAITRRFQKEHRDCDPNDPENKAAVAKRYAFDSPAAWLASWETGASARVILQTFAGVGMRSDPFGREGNPPMGPSDFGRCSRLLAAPFAAGWRARLAEVAAKFPAWAPYVAAWDELDALHAEEHPTGKAPKLYARMKELRGGAEPLAGITVIEKTNG